MANNPRTRKRVHATIVRRAPDGSAFKNCDTCGETVAIALADMHECENKKKKELKRFKGVSGTQNLALPEYPAQWQPRSAFNIFMEGFMSTNKGGNLIDIDRKGFETWKCMSEKERQPYVTQAEEKNSFYTKLADLEKYIYIIPKKEDDEADSAMVGKIDQKSKRLNLVHHRLVVKNSTGFDENGSFNGFTVKPNKLFMQEAIGAEYGEGFETFRLDGPLKVDVDYLNDRLQEGFLKRIRYAMKPDEAYGLIFSWDNVVSDTRTLKLNAWKQLALEEGKEIPEKGDAQRMMLYAAADHVINKILQWEIAEGEVDRLKSRLSQIYYDNLLEIRKPIDGLEEWLDAVHTAGIPCAVVSGLDRRNMVDALERIGLKKYFQAIVSEEDGMESIAHRFLSAAMKLDRKPSKCVVFEDDPRGIAAAHNCTMMAVALIGAHPAYDLGQADLAVANLNELSVINLRRLFANKGSTFMDRQKQIIEKTPPKRKLTVDTIF
ncbi:HAD-superfamily hydrolase, subfamily IA, variant 3 [Corchorus olitorius]|uniref:HAD-superfamily hydrolase, subfamily IA, variant 3 n=1 Tax=Corchorus olitorius TaxID=93759 RepID=A0A1R3HU66_9ROSI|nr:HAD-superfamily hydrolase, subfamily IA, variant 3 [Corchorus olitorius]